MKANSLKHKLEREQVIPYTTLQSNKENLVLFFYHGNRCQECLKKLKELIDSYVKINSLDSEVIAITLRSTISPLSQLDDLQTPFPILIDEVGDFAKKFTYIDGERGGLFFIFVTDRYGAVRFQEIVEEANYLPNVNDAIDWLILIQSECLNVHLSELYPKERFSRT
ncbi:MAG: redoxin domain-containing protein [Nitrososphaeria archaeon]